MLHQAFKSNPNHAPAGSSHGGEFISSGGASIAKLGYYHKKLVAHLKTNNKLMDGPAKELTEKIKEQAFGLVSTGTKPNALSGYMTHLSASQKKKVLSGQELAPKPVVQPPVTPKPPAPTPKPPTPTPPPSVAAAVHHQPPPPAPTKTLAEVYAEQAGHAKDYGDGFEALNKAINTHGHASPEFGTAMKKTQDALAAHTTAGGDSQKMVAEQQGKFFAKRDAAKAEVHNAAYEHAKLANQHGAGFAASSPEAHHLKTEADGHTNSGLLSGEDAGVHAKQGADHYASKLTSAKANLVSAVQAFAPYKDGNELAHHKKMPKASPEYQAYKKAADIYKEHYNKHAEDIGMSVQDKAESVKKAYENHKKGLAPTSPVAHVMATTTAAVASGVATAPPAPKKPAIDKTPHNAAHTDYPQAPHEWHAKGNEFLHATKNDYEALPSAAKTALKDYTNNGYEWVNKYLGTKEVSSGTTVAEMEKRVKNIAKATESMSMPQDLKLYRAVRLSRFNTQLPADVKAALSGITNSKKAGIEKMKTLTGMTFKDPAFGSSSMKPQTAQNFQKTNEHFIMEVETPKGTKGSWVGGTYDRGGHPEEAEFVFTKDTKFTITGARKTSVGGSEYYVLTAKAHK